MIAISLFGAHSVQMSNLIYLFEQAQTLQPLVLTFNNTCDSIFTIKDILNEQRFIAIESFRTLSIN
jgi:hypothetical protein